MKKRCMAFALALSMIFGMTVSAGAANAEGSNPIEISVDSRDEIRTISSSIFGAIQNQGRMGEGAADESGQPYPGFVEAIKAMGVTELRYPGGSMGGMIFDWREAIGPIEERKLTYARTSNPGQILNYGVDEMAQMAEDCGMTINLCINAHMLGVKEALQYLAYTTMEADDTPLARLNPDTDLQYWANLRASYGHEAPYDVTRVDIGNEEDGTAGWRTGEFVSLSDRYTPAVLVTEENQSQALYAFGGITEFTNVNTITYEDLSSNAALSDGSASLQKRAPYVDIVDNDTCHIYVDGVEWTIVDDLSTQAADATVCTVNYDTGYITFGDDEHGAIPGEGTRITLTYQTEHEGYEDYYDAIHAQFPGIHVSAKTSAEEFMQLMGDVYPYDSISYHPLGANQPGKSVTDLTEHYYQQLASVAVTMQQEEIRLEKLAEYAGANEPTEILSAYGHAQGNFPNGEADWHLNLAEGILCANELIGYINGGFTVACNFLLNDMPYDPDTSDAPSARRYNAMVYSRLGSDEFVITPKGWAFSLISSLSGQTQVAASVENNLTVPLTGYDPQSGGGMFPYFPVENPRTDSLDVMQVISTKDERGDLSLVVVNNHATDEITAAVNLNGYSHESAVTVSEFNGEDFTTINTPENPDAVGVTTNRKELGEGNFEYTFPAHSITRFEISAKSQSSNSGSSTTSKYSIDVKQAENGAVTASSKSAAEGRKVTLTVAPNTGYTLAELTVTDAEGNKVNLTEKDGAYVFTMPKTKITVKATFKAVPEETDSPALSYTEYTDLVPGAWYQDAVDYALREKLMTGISQSEFAPDETLTRSMFVQILWAVKEKPSVDYSVSFEDVGDSNWYTEAVRWAVSEGIATGYSDKSFGPDDPITREQLMAMLYVFAQKENHAAAATGQLDYADADSVSAWASDGVRWCTKQGIVSGKDQNRLDPLGTATRAEAAQVLMRLCEFWGK